MPINDKTVGSYIENLCQAYLFYKIPRYDIKGKKYLASSEKYYLSEEQLNSLENGSYNASKPSVKLEITDRGLCQTLDTMSGGNRQPLVRAGNKSLQETLEKNEINISGGVKRTVKVEATQKANVLLTKNSAKEITRTTEWNKKIEAPLKKGDILGYVNLFSGEKQVGRIPVTAKEDVKKLSIWVAFSNIFAKMFNL